MTSERRGECGARLRAFGRCSNSPLIDDIAQVSNGPIEEDELVRVDAAKVVCANYQAIIRDFPQIFGADARRENPLPGCARCAASGDLCSKAIDEWLLRHAAFVSKQQTFPNSVNTPIRVTSGPPVKAYRPPHYGRSAIVPIGSAGLSGHAGYLDLKGVGVASGMTPSHKIHSNGLEYLGNALVDFFFGWLVDTVFARSCPTYHVVPVYAVLDLGFDLIDGGYGQSPAGLHVRRAHSRPYPILPLSGGDEEKLSMHVEMLLRYYGLTTSGYLTTFELEETDAGRTLICARKPVPVETDAERRKAEQLITIMLESGVDHMDILNVQSTNGGNWEQKRIEIFDFGHVKAVRDFSVPLANPIRDGALRIGRVVSPAHSAFVRPNREVAVDPDLCDREAASAFGFFAATRFRNAPKHFDRSTVELMLRLGRLKALGRDISWATRQTRAA